MLATERQQLIIALLAERGTVRTIDLAEEFQVADETIRRDLQVLSEMGHLTRIHGGACSLNGRPLLQSFTERRTINVEKKQIIAKAALQYIQPGRTYAFDSSTTVFELVSMMPDTPCRVITNAYSVLDYLARLEHVELVCTGGRFHRKTQTFVGGESIDTLRRHNINTAFISCIGLDPEHGVSEGFEQQATFKDRLVRFAEEVVLLIDSTKLGKRSEYFFALLNQIDHVITDTQADPIILSQLKDCVGKITLA